MDIRCRNQWECPMSNIKLTLLSWVSFVYLDTVRRERCLQRQSRPQCVSLQRLKGGLCGLGLFRFYGRLQAFVSKKPVQNFTRFIKIPRINEVDRFHGFPCMRLQAPNTKHLQVGNDIPKMWHCLKVRCSAPPPTVSSLCPGNLDSVAYSPG